MDLAVFAGILSTGLFAMSYLPMLVKAARTRDLSSYSFGNLAITNAGNALYSVYVFSLPVGPIWFLHTFYLVASALMLVWFLRSGRLGSGGVHARRTRSGVMMPNIASAPWRSTRTSRCRRGRPWASWRSSCSTEFAPRRSPARGHSRGRRVPPRSPQGAR